jgi:hypothetical protein
MNPVIRPATRDDLPALDALLVTMDGAPRDLEASVGSGSVLLALAGDGEIVGVVVARAGREDEGDDVWLWVLPEARRQGAAKTLATRALDGLDATRLRDHQEARLQRASFGSIHVQTDDEAFVERAARQFVPRLGRSQGTVIIPPRDGWIAVYDELCDHDRKAHRRFAQELSERLGIVVVALAVEEEAVVRLLLFDRGRMVDEYLSVPEHHGALPPADVLALAINPPLVARLTGADPVALRAVARTATSSDELPPPAELIMELGALLGLHGTGHGYAGAEPGPGAVRVEYGAG